LHPIYILNGPNLNLLGSREPHLYGRHTLADAETLCRTAADRYGYPIEFRQTNFEGQMVDWVQEARTASGIVINPAGFSYHGVAVLDALKMCECPVVEMHITNIHQRAAVEAPWRADSIISQAVTGVIAGLGVEGYRLAIEFIAARLAEGQA